MCVLESGTTPTTFTTVSQSTASIPTTPTESTVSTVKTTATTASTGTFVLSNPLRYYLLNLLSVTSRRHWSCLVLLQTAI